MSHKHSKGNRRKLLKSIAAGSGAVVVAGKSLPDLWSKPVVDSILLPAHALTSITDETNTSGSDGSDTGGCDALVIPATNQLCTGYITDTRYWYVDDSGDCPALVAAKIEPKAANKIEITREVSAPTVSITVIVGIQTTITDQICGKPKQPFEGSASSSVDAIGSDRKFRVKYSRSIDASGAYIGEINITPL